MKKRKKKNKKKIDHSAVSDKKYRTWHDDDRYLSTVFVPVCDLRKN